MTIDECRELRNELVSEGLKQPKSKPERKRGKRPPDAKIPSEPKKTEKPKPAEK